jgi:hypothetical protein
VLPDLAVLNDPSFAAISVTAEQWLPIEAVAPAVLLPWWGARRCDIHGFYAPCASLPASIDQ